MKYLIAFMLALCFMTTSVVSAQDSENVQNDTTETVHIAWPKPVTELWGTTEILGTAAVPGMAYYYLEYIALNDDLSLPENAPWLPVTVGITRPVVSGSLTSLDTTLIPDGTYILRLTVNTVDGQSYHDFVWPLRIANERFTAVLAGTEQEATPEAAPTQAAGDTTPHVVASSQYHSINVRRCDLIDNDRCPIIAALRSGESALVLALSSNNTGWLQIQLPAGTVGWVSPTVVEQQGDFSSVGRTQPPAPLAAPAVAQPPAAVVASSQASSVVPNGLAIEGGSATCNRTFNVQINLNNNSGGVAPEGTVTLQDVNVGTGEVTFTGYANYLSLNPGANFVVVIPVRTSVYYNEDHELRAFSNGRQVSTRYDLRQGDCGQSSHHSDNRDDDERTQRNFNGNQCQIEITDNGEVYFDPEDNEVADILEPGVYVASQVKRVGGRNWYEVFLFDDSLWIIGSQVDRRGDCGLDN